MVVSHCAEGRFAKVAPQERHSCGLPLAPFEKLFLSSLRSEARTRNSPPRRSFLGPLPNNHLLNYFLLLVYKLVNSH